MKPWGEEPDPERTLPNRPQRLRSLAGDALLGHQLQSTGDSASRLGQVTTTPLTSFSNGGSLTPGTSASLGSSHESVDGRPLSDSLTEQDLASKLNHFGIDSASNHGFLSVRRIKEFVEEYLTEFFNTGQDASLSWTRFFGKYCSSRYQFLGPSGDSMTRKEFAAVFANGEMKLILKKLVSTESISLLKTGRGAVVVYTVDEKFSFRGKMHEDRAVISCVVELRNGSLKVLHEHRTSGIPIPKETRWSSD
jgi:hypothetical protein